METSAWIAVFLPSARLNAAEKAALSHVKVPETAVITVLEKGMKADRWRDTNRKRR